MKNEYLPVWRKPTRHPQVGLARAMLVFSSLASLPFMFVRPKEGYELPISIQLARGDVAAWICLGAMVATLALFARNLWAYRKHAPAIGCMAVATLLVLIGATDPLSTIHLQLFLALALILVVVHRVLLWLFKDPRLFATTIWLTMAVFVCLGALGIGERMMIVGSVVTINVIVAEYTGGRSPASSHQRGVPVRLGVWIWWKRASTGISGR